MANLNKINVDGGTYDIEDTQAREDARAAMAAASEALGIINGETDPNEPTDPTEPGAPLKAYGVRWYKTQSLTRLDRLHDAVGLTFSPSVGSTPGRSDFDAIYPWRDIKLCDVANGAVTYYEGEAGFSRAPAVGDVAVEIPAFYYKVDESSLHRDITIASNVPGTDPQPEGYLLSPRHMATPGNPEGWSKIYTSAYTLNSAYRSISGDAPIVSITRSEARAGCRNRGAGHQLYDYATYATICLLYLVEVADWDSQVAIGPGYTDASNTAKINTGGADGVAWHSGRATGNASAAKNAVKYRHMENLWGNIWNWCDGMNFNGSTIYLNMNPATYNDNVGTGDYAALSYAKALANGFQKVLGFDPNYPFTWICQDATGADGTFVSDYYYQDTGWRALMLGGHWSDAAIAGLFDFSSAGVASNVHAHIGARLLILP
jgi:hypothetical protein